MVLIAVTVVPKVGVDNLDPRFDDFDDFNSVFDNFIAGIGRQDQVVLSNSRYLNFFAAQVRLILRGLIADLVANRSTVDRELEIGLHLDPQRGFAVVRTFGIEILVANHVPKHRAHFAERQTGNPVRPIAAQAYHSIVGDVGVERRGLPSQIGNHSGIRGAQFDEHFMMLRDGDEPVTVALEASPFEHQPIFLRRIASGFEREDRTIGLQLLNRLKIGIQPTITRGFSHTTGTAFNLNDVDE